MDRAEWRSHAFRFILMLLLFLLFMSMNILNLSVSHVKTSKWAVLSPKELKDEIIDKPSCSYAWGIAELPQLDVYKTTEYKKQANARVVPEWLYRNPKYKLDPKRFLLTFMKNGPNNQLIELRNTILLAIMLNRTLVLPQFIPHITNTDMGKYDPVSPLHRIDVSKLCQLVPCVHMKDFRKFCNNEINLLIHQSEPVEAGAIWRKLGMNLSKDAEIQLQTDQFYSEKSCGMTNLFLSSVEETAEVKDLKLEIEKSTDLPPYIHQIAEDFIHHYTGNKEFISVHWRYNKMDYQLRCTKTKMGIDLHISEKYLRACNFLDSLKPENISKAFMNFAKDENGKFQYKTFYIATPASEIPLIREVAHSMRKEGFTILTQIDLDNFLKEKHFFSTCPRLKTLYFDIKSNVEMAICARGVRFSRSLPSSWSTNVIILKKIRDIPIKYDIDNFRLLGFNFND